MITYENPLTYRDFKIFDNDIFGGYVYMQIDGEALPPLIEKTIEECVKKIDTFHEEQRKRVGKWIEEQYLAQL